MWLADTTFLIDLVKGDPGASEKASNIDQPELAVYTSVITITEYPRGIFTCFEIVMN